MRIYETAEGDMLDQIAYLVYGDESLVTEILDQNPGLVEQPLVLPHGVLIQLPDLPEQPALSAIADVWG